MEETGFGVFEDKVIKNYVATEFLYDHLRDKRTVGVIEEDRERALSYVAEPIGVVLALLPITNPTSTALFKAIVAAKTRNAVVFRPSARAARCAERAIEIVRTAGEAAGLPPRRAAGRARRHARRLAVPLPPLRRRLHLDHRAARRPSGDQRGGQAVHRRRPGQRAGLRPSQRRRPDGGDGRPDLQDVRRVRDLPGRADARGRRRRARRRGRRAGAHGRPAALGGRGRRARRRGVRAGRPDAHRGARPELPALAALAGIRRRRRHEGPARAAARRPRGAGAAIRSCARS